MKIYEVWKYDAFWDDWDNRDPERIGLFSKRESAYKYMRSEIQRIMDELQKDTQEISLETEEIEGCDYYYYILEGKELHYEFWIHDLEVIDD